MPEHAEPLALRAGELPEDRFTVGAQRQNKNLFWNSAARPEHAEPLAPGAEKTNQMINSLAVWSAATKSNVALCRCLSPYS
jgi:hypothetical protein